MKILLIAAATATLGLGAPLAAFADPGGHGKQDEKHGGKHAGKSHDRGHYEGKKAHGMPPGQAKKMWRRGERLPTTYVTNVYYVENPRAYRLRTPPPGYRWVHVDDQYYLAQTRNGMITEVVSALLR